MPEDGLSIQLTMLDESLVGRLDYDQVSVSRVLGLLVGLRNRDKSVSVLLTQRPNGTPTISAMVVRYVPEPPIGFIASRKALEEFKAAVERSDMQEAESWVKVFRLYPAMFAAEIERYESIMEQPE